MNLKADLSLKKDFRLNSEKITRQAELSVNIFAAKLLSHVYMKATYVNI